MRSSRPRPRLFSGLISILVCCALLATPAASALQGVGSARVSQPSAVRPEKGAPVGNLPNLDDVKRRAPAHPKAQPPLPSRLKKYRFEGKGVELSPRADADAPRASSLPGAQIAAAYNPYAGVELASAGRTLPEPPRSRLFTSTASSWSAPFAGLFGAFAATLRRSAEGQFEDANCSAVSGWAWDTAQPNTPIIVTLFDGSQQVASVLADQYRADLVNKGDNRHGFSIPLPDSLRDGLSHTLNMKVQGTPDPLAYSPKIVTSCTVAYDGAITSADCDQVTGWAWDAQRPSTPIDVDLYVDGVFRARAAADVYNAQLNKGDNRHQFRVPTPVAARDGQPHSITLRPVGSGQNLGSSASVTCNGPNYVGYLDGANCTWVYGWAWDSNRPNTPINVDLYSDGQFVTTVTADTYRPDLTGFGDRRHGFQIAVPDALRGGATHTLTARVGGGGPFLNYTASLNCAASSGCSASQSLPSTEFVKDFYLGALARQPRPLELQYWNDALRSAAAQSQPALLAKAKLLGRELFLEGEYAGRGRMTNGHEAEYVSDLYWSYLQRGPDASGQSFWGQTIQTQNQQQQNGWLNALNSFQESSEFSARVSGVCPAPADSVKSYDAAADFSPLQNADGAWDYGYKTAGGAFTLFPSNANVFGAGTDSWTQPSISACCPFVTRNNTAATLSYAGNVVQPTSMLNLHPGPNGERGVVKWTAPALGTYIFQGLFQGISTNGTTSDVLVTHNGATVFSANVNGFGATAPFNVTRQEVQAGDTIEFSVGVGTNGTYNSDSTGLAVTIYQPSPAQTLPYGGTAAQAPGQIEAELFDAGGEGVAYHDTTSGSHGQDYDQPQPYPTPAFRQPTDVDIYKQAANYSNGYVVVMQAGDWMNYTVDVAQAGSYTLSAQTYWGASGGTFHVEADGSDVTGPLQLPGGSSWQTVTKAGVQLNAGRHVLRVVCDTNGSDGYMGEIDYLRLTPSADSGLVGYWKFDEGSGSTAADSSGGGHAGTLQGGAGWAVGSSGSSISLDGADDYVQVGAAGPSSVGTTGLTVSAWLYPTGGGASAGGGIVVNKEGEYELARYQDGTIRWAIADSTNSWNWVNTGYVVPQGQWTHLALTCDGSSVKTYANGQLVHTAARTGGFGDAEAGMNDFRIGGRQLGSQNFQGRLDEVRVYNRALSAAEVSTLVGPPTSGMVGYWKFDEGAGTAVADASGNGNAGTLQAGTAWGVGQSGGAVTLDGADDYVGCGSSSSLAVSGGLTVSAWVYPTGNVVAMIVNKEGEYELLRYPDGTIRWAVANQSPGWASVNTGVVAPLNVWTHVAFTYDGASGKTYANGQLAHTAAASGVIGDVSPGMNEFRIGGRQESTGSTWAGLLDEVRVYNRGLAAGEVGALAAMGSTDPTGNNFSEARKNPVNETGSGGDDPLSRNFSFSVPLVGLKGRAGLDLGLSLSYNSLVWTRDAATGVVKFDADDGDPSPGFRLGLPVIQGKYRNARNENAYMLVTPSGARVELRQVGTSTTYEAIDSSYTQLTEESGLVLRPSDGSQVSFTLQGTAFKPTKIKDRNGNYISLTYNAAGDVSSITDTLGRVLTCAYDSNSRPIAVEQDRGGQAHQWATFGYSNLTVSPGFAGGVSVLGPASGTVMSVLTQVSLDDGSRYNFLYNSWGQVYRREYHAPDGRLLSYTEYDLQSPTTAQTNGGTDCPRFTQRRDFAKDWNGDAPVVTSYSVDQSGVQVVRNNQTLVNGAGADTAATVMQKISYGTANSFRRGLVTAVETWGQDAPGQFVLKRTAQTAWTQDDEALTYQLNPRVKVSEVSDPQGNHTGTTVDYTSYGLPTEVREWSVSYAPLAQPVEVMQWSGENVYVLRRTHTEYNLDPAYVGRRLLGLVSSTSVYDETGHVAAKVDYTYDQGGEFLQHQGEPVQHDGANYGPTFVIGRGLVTSVRRWDVTALHDATKSVESRAGYNTTGSPVFSRDPLGHQSTVSYADKFSDKAGTNTLAYPTLATNPDGYSSKVEYNFHTGLVSRTEDPKGAQQTFTYDATGRTLRVETSGRGATANQVISGGYTRWVYSEAMDAVQSLAQVDAGMPEVCSISILDGAGRVRASASDLPNSTGGYSAQYTSYDIAGRTAGQTNPTEVSGLWNPAGDDAARGWKWTTQTFDWKSRPLVTTLPKLLNQGDQGYASEPLVTRQAEYGGCGCAGGEVVTLTDEVGRRSRGYSDALGRRWQTEVLNTNGTGYSSATTKYNALDQPVRVRRYLGAAPSPEPDTEGGTYQTSTITYDGHGRLKTRRLPADAAGRLTTYTYFIDDTVESVTDPRGVVATFSYNGRGLPTLVHHNGSGATLPDGSPANLKAVPDVTYSYDESGRRTGMTDGLGAMAYGFDSVGRLASETRTFNDPDNPVVNNLSRSIAYKYTTAGALKSLTLPDGKVVSYGYDQTGQLTGVSGTTPAGTTTQFASNISYRAWGAVKAFGYGNNLTHAFAYDARLRPSTFSASGADTSTGAQVTLMSADYLYRADGGVYARDLTDARFNRAYSYDHAGRLLEAYSGSEADAFVSNTSPGTGTGAYRNSYQYDGWDNLKVQTQRYWSQQSLTTTTPYDSHNRVSGWLYDAAGNVLLDDALQYSYDAAGRPYKKVSDPSAPVPTTIIYDGDGGQAGLIETVTTGSGNTLVSHTYTMRSTVLGGLVVCDLDDSLSSIKAYVYAGGTLVAEWSNLGTVWVSKDPLTGSRRETGPDYLTIHAASRVEPDPMGVNVGTQPPPAGGGGHDDSEGRGRVELASNYNCKVDGILTLCSIAERGLESGAAVQCPDNDCGPRNLTVTAVGGDGRVLGSTTMVRQAGQAGWDGSLDGIYRRYGHGTLNWGDASSNAGALLSAFAGVGVGGIGEFFTGAFRRVSGGSQTTPQNPTGPWVDPSTVDEAPPLPNPNCIERAVPGGKGKLSGRGLEEAISAATGPPVRTNLPRHNGQHILIKPGTTEPFIALPAMAGTVIHGAHQSTSTAGFPFAMVDILLDTRIDGQQYVMTLTDHYYDGAKLRGRVRPGDLLGNITGADDSRSESGMHVTLMPYSVWKEFIGNKRFAPGSRDRVPFNALMGAGTDPRSPFKCP